MAKRKIIEEDYLFLRRISSKINVGYEDINGNPKNEIFEGFLAALFCHEFDHLNGIFHTDRSFNIYYNKR